MPPNPKEHRFELRVRDFPHPKHGWLACLILEHQTLTFNTLLDLLIWLEQYQESKGSVEILGIGTAIVSRRTP